MARSAEVPTTEEAVSLMALIGDLAGTEEVARSSFQSVAVAALQSLNRVACCERQLAGATLSLAQHQRLQDMIGGVEGARGLLRCMLSPRNAAVLDANTPSPETTEPSWWFALCEALHVLEEEQARMASIPRGQPRSRAAGALCSHVAALLEDHYRTLFTEAERWMV